jgi:murein DD-endopeptidase MepM/ murein hydrolase activator NlpD
MQTPIRHWDGSHDHRRRTAGPAGPRSRRLSSAAAVVADIALAALGAALIVFSDQYSLDAGVAILVLIAAVAAAAARLVQAFRGRVELDVLHQPLRPDLRPHLLQFLNYALLAALILIAGALGTFTNLPLYASILLPASDRISGQQFTIAVQLAALALAALALVPARRVRPIRNLAVLAFSIFLAVSLAPALAPPRAVVAVDLPLEGEWAMVAGGRSRLLSHHYANPSGRDALDFARLVDGQAFAGDPEHHASWHGYGQPVLAPADGTVVSVRDDLADAPVGVIGQGEGNTIVLDIGSGRYVVFAHLQQGSALVRADQSVTRGQRIAAVGTNGNSFSPHLHVQIQDRPSLPSEDRDVRTFPMVFEHTTLTRGGRESTPPTADLRRGDVIRADR